MKRSRSDSEDSTGGKARTGLGGFEREKFGISVGGSFGNEASAEAQLDKMLAGAGVPPMMNPPGGAPPGMGGGKGDGLWFGGGGGGGKGGGGPCFTCGGDHFVKDCPMVGAPKAMNMTTEPRVETTQMDFSKLTAQNLSSATIPISKKLVEYLMTPECRRLLLEESGANVDFVPDEATIQLSGSAEQVKRAQRLLARVLMHCRWGISTDKVRRLLKPHRAESVLCRLSPMNTLRAAKKTLSPGQKLMTLGKDPKNDSVLRHAVVSRQHVILELDPDRGAVYVIDSSTNGTWLNGTKLPSKQGGKVLLSHGDELLLKDPSTGEQDFGYIVNLTELTVKEEQKLEAPRRILTSDEINGRGDFS
jgi:hypothetical protein